ncbi:MAG: diaminopimelate epimerase [Promethearchaeota archaeon]
MLNFDFKEMGSLRKGNYLIQNLEFYKYHGLGNDFIIIDNIKSKIPEKYLPDLARKLCFRQFWVGADGIILIEKPSDPRKFDIRYRMFNPDGSEAEMCGNGIRCFAVHLYNYGIVKKDKINIETLAGLIVPKLNFYDESEESPDHNGNSKGDKSDKTSIHKKIIKDVTVDMGVPIFEREKIPVANPENIQNNASINNNNNNNDNNNNSKSNNNKECLNETLVVEDQKFTFSAVSMGNPHAVIFVDNIDWDILKKYGPLIEKNKLFPQKINVEFVQVLSETEANFAVWERGAGITLACGTGASASVAVGVKLGKFKPNTDIKIHLPGGDLSIKFSQNKIWMTGEATFVYKGNIEKIYVL